MPTFSAESFAATMALIGVVILVAALLSGLVERIGVPQVALFLVLGILLGPQGLGLVELTLESPALYTITTLSLVLVLFTDSVTIDIAGLKKHARVAFIVLGPGTLLTAAIVSLAAWWLLHLAPAAAAILGAALASTDPVMMRGLLRRKDVPVAARTALQVESGLNDVILLPIVLLAMPFLAHGGAGQAGPMRTGLNVLLLGPAAGAAVGLVSVAVLEFVRKRFGMRRDYESIYVLGIALTAFAAAEALHGSGFMAAFAAGLTVALVDVDMCECFHDYGEATAEMFLLFAFVAFGGSLIWVGLDAINGRTLVFALVALFARSLVLLVAGRGTLARDPAGRNLIVWFGPRGLSSLLLVLLPLFAGLEQAKQLFPVAALVVLLSVVVHGGVGMLLTGPGKNVQRAAYSVQREELVESVESVGSGGASGGPPVRRSANEVLIRMDEFQRLQQSGETVVLLDVRKHNAYYGSELKAKGAVRLDPDRPVESAAQLALPRHGWLVGYCA